MPRDPRTFYRVPDNPLARFGLALVGVTVLVLSFFVGLVFLAVAAGLAVLGGLALSVRGWWLRRRGGGTTPDDDLVEVEYRIVRREREDD